MTADGTNRAPALMPIYNPFPVAFERGEGAYLFDTDGKKYLDFAAGIGVMALGHCHPHLVAALTEQAGKLWHTTNMYRIPEQQRLAERLVEATFADSMFFTNSGVEALELVIKLMRKYHSENGAPERYRIITLSNAFHGRSLATIAASGKEKLIAGFGPMPEGFDIVPFGDLDAARAAIGPETAGILAEPIQGEGGIFPMTAEHLQGLRALADEHGILLALDEVQCGMGRTGKLFAHEWAGVEPDIMAAAKGIGGGFPLGACLAKGSVGQAMKAGSHGSTYGGNPLAMAVGNAVMDEMSKPEFLAGVRAISAHVMAELNALKGRSGGRIKGVRGLGLMIGIEIDQPARPILAKMLEQGFLAAQAGDNVLRFLPPLIINEDHVTEAISHLAAGLDIPSDE